MAHTRNYRSRLIRVALGLIVFAGVASAQLIGFNVRIVNDTGQPGYRLRIYTENPIASTAFGLPLNSYMVDSVEGTEPAQYIVEFSGPLAVPKLKSQTVVWVVERSLPSNITAYQLMSKDGTVTIGNPVYALRFQTDSSGLVSIVNPGSAPIQYTNLRLTTRGLKLLAPVSAQVAPGNPQPVVALGDAANVALSFTDPRCGVIYYHRPD